MSGLLQEASLRQALEPYTHAGPYGILLDSDSDPVLGAEVLGIEMGALMSSPLALGAFLPALVRTLERGFDGRPTLLILDEAWSYLRDPAFSAQVQAWLKTLRKKNVAVVFATQELADVEASAIAATILESCPTRIFLANERAREQRTWDFYAGLGLNPRQIHLIASAIPKRDYYVQTALGARRVDLELGPAALAFLGASRPEDHQRIDKVLRDSPEHFAAAWRCARHSLVRLHDPGFVLARDGPGVRSDAGLALIVGGAASPSGGGRRRNDCWRSGHNPHADGEKRPSQSREWQWTQRRRRSPVAGGRPTQS